MQVSQTQEYMRVSLFNNCLLSVRIHAHTCADTCVCIYGVVTNGLKNGALSASVTAICFRISLVTLYAREHRRSFDRLIDTFIPGRVLSLTLACKHLYII